MKMWAASSRAGDRDPKSKPRPRGAARVPGPDKQMNKQVGKPRRRWLRVVKWMSIAVLASLALAAATIAFVFWLYGRDPNLPNIESLGDYKPKQVTQILDANDRRIGELFSERRTFVPYDQIPPIVVESFVAAEDNSFWTHGGVDYWGMARAFVSNLRAGHTKQGASTITQQVVKTFLLTPERTFKRKIQEIILARRIERSLTKQEIMTLYLNQIYFGHGRYGIEEAARFYFGKSVPHLNIGEAALLAGLPQSPENISPRKNPQRAKERQIYVLGQLVRLGKLTQGEAQKWIEAPIKVIDTPFPELGTAPEWVDLAHKQLVKLGRIADPSEKAIDTLGARVRTTLDPTLQATAQRALQAGLRAVDKREGIGRARRSFKGDKIELELAKLAKNLPASGPAPGTIYDAIVTAVRDDQHELAVDLGKWPATLALGGADDARYNPPDDSGKTKLPSERFKIGDVVLVTLAGEPAFHGDAKKSKPAAAAKPRVAFAPGPEGAVVILEVKTRKVRALVGGYATKIAGLDRAIQAERQPGSSFKPFVYATAIDSGKLTAASRLADAPEVYEQYDKWKPKNYETGKYEGLVTLRHALARSINTVSLRIVEQVTPESVVAMARRLGIPATTRLEPTMSLALGAYEVRPIDMVNALATLAAGGIAAEPRYIEAIDGKALAPPKGEQVLRPEVAYVVLSMMQSVVTEGTGIKAAALKIPIAGKTGTSNDSKDVWFVGLTPDYAIGVWIGYDGGGRTMSTKETGGTTAVPVYVDIMKAMAQPAKAFPKPAHVVEVVIDRETGLVAPDGAPKGTTRSEVFVDGTQPHEVAPKPGEVTEGSSVTGEFGD